MKRENKTIVLDRIKDPASPLRGDLSHEAVEDLTESIKIVGIIEPLVVRKVGESFEIIAGHRRLVAAGIAGLTEVPCVVVVASDEEAELLKLHENLNRDDINPIDWAKHLDHLKQQYGYSTAKLAKILGMSDAWVSQHMAILKYDPALLEGLRNDMLSFSSARELALIKDPKKRGVYIKHAIIGGVTPKMAIQWRKEANREGMPDPTPTTTTKAEETTPSEPVKLPVCDICAEQIEEGDELHIVVHKKCGPQ